MRRIACLTCVLGLAGCSDGGDARDAGAFAMERQDAAPTAGAAPVMPFPDAAPTPDAASPATLDASSAGARDTGADAMPAADGATVDAAEADAALSGPNVDRSDPKLHSFEFSADDADSEASESLGLQLAQLDTRVTPLGKLVVYLHGAGSEAPARCGATEHGLMLARLGFHVFQPCYNSYYGVGNCGQDIGGCRLEAIEGVDHHAFVAIAPPDAIERRIVKALVHLQALAPEGDWQFFVDGDAPRWSQIIISGISHGASSAGVIGIHRGVDRVVMLSGPLDTGQAWLESTKVTPRDRFWAFSHTADGQHSGHLEAFEALGLPGVPTLVDDADAPYGGSHRLITSAATSDGHGSTQAGGSSPRAADEYVFEPVWRQLYVGP
jgi:hypothetical protein